MTKTTLLATILGLGMGLGLAAPAMAYGERDATAPMVRDVGREAFHPPGPGTPLPMRPQALAREHMPTGMPGWAHNGTDMVSNGQAAYPVLTQTALDHPPSGLDHGALLTERFQGPGEAPSTFAAQDDMAFDG